MPSTPLEELVLEAIRAALAAAEAGPDYFYSCEFAGRVVSAQVKDFGEVHAEKFLALVQADQMLYVQESPGTNCGTDANGQVIVTVATPYRGTDDVKSVGHDLPTVQQRLVHDARKALHYQPLLDGVTIQVTDRNLQVEVGGWAVAQVSVAWAGHEVL